MIATIRGRILRQAIEVAFLAGLGLTLFVPGIPYRSFSPAAIPCVAWLILDRAWRLRRERRRLRSLREPYLLVMDLEEL